MDEHTSAEPRKRLRHRIPTSLRQHWTIAVALVAFVALVGTVFGTSRIRPYITGDPTVIASEITENIAGTVDLFDTSVDHEVSIDISDVEYDDMIDAYVDDGEKEWVTADVTIDGTVITDVGVRLKGNSTLSALRGGMGEGPGGGEGSGGPPGGSELPGGFELPDDVELPEGFDLRRCSQGVKACPGWVVPVSRRTIRRRCRCSSTSPRMSKAGRIKV